MRVWKNEERHGMRAGDSICKMYFLSSTCSSHPIFTNYSAIHEILVPRVHNHMYYKIKIAIHVLRWRAKDKFIEKKRTKELHVHRLFSNWLVLVDIIA